MKKSESINIASTYKIDLAKKHNTTKVTVQNALHFFNNSALAKEIRASAKQILLDEAKKI